MRLYQKQRRTPLCPCHLIRILSYKHLKERKYYKQLFGSSAERLQSDSLIHNIMDGSGMIIQSQWSRFGTLAHRCLHYCEKSNALRKYKLLIRLLIMNAQFGMYSTVRRNSHLSGNIHLGDLSASKMCYLHIGFR